MTEKLYMDFISAIKDGNPLIIFITIALALLFQYKNIIEFFDSRKKVKISKIEEALKNENIQGLGRKLLENELTKEHFKTSLGLNVEQEFREAIIKAHKSTKGEVIFIHFQRALPYLKFEDHTLKVKISKLNWFGFIINMLLSTFLIFIGYALFFYEIFHFSLSSIFQVLTISLFSMLMGFLFLFESRHIISAKIVLKKLKR